MKNIKINRHGFSLVEVCIALLVLSIGVFSLFAIFPAGLKESESGVADTHEAMFADRILSAFEGKALNMTNWNDWTDMAFFKDQLIAAVDVPQFAFDQEKLSCYPLTGGATNIKYKVTIFDVLADGSRKKALIQVKYSKYGQLVNGSVYSCDLVYLGL